MLDRLGRRLNEHDLRLRLEEKQAARVERERQRREERPPSHHNERERSRHSRPLVERSPPHHSRQQSRLRNGEDEVESRVYGYRRNNPPPSLHGENDGCGPHDEDERLGNLNVHDLRRILNRMEEEKRLPQAVVARSPFTRAILESPPPVNMRHHPELTFDGKDDPASYYMRFNMEMDVYQVPNLTRCRLFAASL